MYFCRICHILQISLTPRTSTVPGRAEELRKIQVVANFSKTSTVTYLHQGPFPSLTWTVALPPKYEMSNSPQGLRSQGENKSLVTFINFNMPGKCFYIIILIIRENRSCVTRLESRAALKCEKYVLKNMIWEKGQVIRTMSVFRVRSETHSSKI